MSSLPSPPFVVEWPSNGDDELNCKYAGEFFATWMTSPDQIKAKTYRGPGLTVAAEYLRVISGDQAATNAALLSWFANEEESAESSGDEAVLQFINSFVQPALENCGPSVCQSLSWTGNADLAGIGVFISYYIEAALATIFFTVLLASHLTGWGKRRATSSDEDRFSHRLWGAFLTALSDLRLSIFVFSIAVMFASLKALISAQDDPLSVTTYDITTAMLVTIFSVCPATLLYCMGEHSKGRKTLQLLILFVLWAIMLVIVNLSRRTDPSKNSIEAGLIGHPFEVYCPVLGDSYLEALRILAVVFSALVLLWLLFLGLSKCLRWESTKLRHHTRKHWPVGFAILALVAMWVFLAVFTAMRARIIEVAGASDKSNEWGFGQIIALATWAPVILNFAYNLFSILKKPQTRKSGEGTDMGGPLNSGKREPED